MLHLVHFLKTDPFSPNKPPRTGVYPLLGPGSSPKPWKTARATPRWPHAEREANEGWLVANCFPVIPLYSTCAATSSFSGVGGFGVGGLRRPFHHSRRIGRTDRKTMAKMTTWNCRFTHSRLPK